jgi:hypothetical protein
VKVGDRVRIIATPSRLVDLGIGTDLRLSGATGVVTLAYGSIVCVRDDESISPSGGFFYRPYDLELLAAES